MSTALPPAAEGLLAEVAQRLPDDGQSAFSLLPRGDDSLKARLALIESATTSLDIKYFIWKGDASGSLLFLKLIEAAERGVRVRLLIDDLNLVAEDEELAGLDKHPNIAINIWNPTEGRSVIGGLLSFAGSFDDLNKRMHNKMLLADGQVAVIGGRNIADEYFGLTNKYNFLDMDVLVVGPTVADVGSYFDEYWASDLCVSVSEISPNADAHSLADFIEEERGRVAEHDDLLGPLDLDRDDWGDWLQSADARWHLGEALYVHDDPVRAGEETKRLADYLDDLAAPTERELDLVSAYLIPSDQLLSNVKEHTDRGVRVRIVTGTQESINHTAAYAHYRGDIGRILDSGAELYEIDGQPPADIRRAADTPPSAGKYVAIHLKGLVSDRRVAFVGSLNLDPRAMDINTEGGLLIDSVGLASELADIVDLLTDDAHAWRVTRDEDGSLVWTGKGKTQGGSPNRGNVQRLAANFFEQLPIRSQL